MNFKDNGTFLTLAATGAVAIAGELAARSRDAQGMVAVVDQVGEVFGSPALFAEKGRNKAAFGAAIGSAILGPLGAAIGGGVGAPSGLKGRAAGGGFGGNLLTRVLTNPIIARKAQERASARAMEMAAVVASNPPSQGVAQATIVSSEPTYMDTYLATPVWVRALNLAGAAAGAYLSVPEDEGSYGDQDW